MALTTDKLYMTFKNTEGEKVTLRVDHADADIDDSKVSQAMKTIINKNIFKHNGSDLKEAVEAKLVKEQVQNVHLTMK